MEEFVARVQEVSRKGKYGQLKTFRITIPKWLAELEGLKGGELIRVIYKGRVGKARKRKLTKSETRGNLGS
ncbi:MAG: hypothetical protein B6U65_03685 [Candidatus Wolframiiraptor sp. EX4484-121]|nr:MAG: hypothetical protein B6U65_03685 [Candidatus Wolframiiraptor sp. EX4484-121]